MAGERHGRGMLCVNRGDSRNACDYVTRYTGLYSSPFSPPPIFAVPCIAGEIQVNLKVLKFNDVVTEWGDIYVIRRMRGELVKSIGEVLNELRDGAFALQFGVC